MSDTYCGLLYTACRLTFVCYLSVTFDLCMFAKVIFVCYLSVTFDLCMFAKETFGCYLSVTFDLCMLPLCHAAGAKLKLCKLATLNLGMLPLCHSAGAAYPAVEHALDQCTKLNRHSLHLCRCGVSGGGRA